MNMRAKQNALDYIMYMILGSYFTKTICKTPLQEKKLLLYYKDLKIDRQLELEKQCIAYVEKLVAALPEEFLSGAVEVRLQEGNPTIIKMQGEKHILYASTEFGKGRPRFHTTLLTKKEMEKADIDTKEERRGEVLEDVKGKNEKEDKGGKKIGPHVNAA